MSHVDFLCYHFFPEKGRAGSLCEVHILVDFVGSVDSDIDGANNLVQINDFEAHFVCKFLRRKGSGNARRAKSAACDYVLVN